MSISPTPDEMSTLAIHGGLAAVAGGPPPWPPADQGVADALRQAISDGSWGRYHGPHISRLERLLREMHDVPCVLTCCSGTVAVELALRGLNVGSGDEVVLAGYDFPGNFRCIEAVGARPVLVDINPQTWCLEVDAIRQALSPRTRAILVSHLHGGIADMAMLRQLADEENLGVIEDACQAPGAVAQGRIAGTWGDVGVLSFGGSKLISAGRGGAIVTRSEEIQQRIKIYCERGNHAFPLSELQAAVLPAQLEQLSQRNMQRRDSVTRLISLTEKLTALRPVDPCQHAGQPSYYKLAWAYDDQHGRASRTQFLAMVQAEGVALDVGFRGFTRRGPRRCRRGGELVSSQQAADSTVLLHHPVLLAGEEAIDQVAAALKKVLDFTQRR